MYEKDIDVTNESRTSFDWIMFLLIHLVLIGGIAYAGFRIYGARLGVWVAASAFIAGVTSSYLFAKIVPGETIMKILLGISVAANAGYLVHNGAQAIGVDAYNAAQIRKYEIGMAAAAGATTRSIARALGASAKDATGLSQAFTDHVATIAAILAFVELALAIIIFSMASKRTNEQRRLVKGTRHPQVETAPVPQPTPAMPYTPPPTATRGNMGFSTAYGNGNYMPPSTNGDSGPKA